MIFYGLLAMLCIHTVHCQNNPNVSVSLERTPNVVIGGIANMTCTVLNPMNLNTSWVKMTDESNTESVVLTSEDVVIVNDSRFSLRQEFVATDEYEGYRCSLLIIGLKKTDEGIYRCQVMLEPNNTIFAETELNVLELEPPKIFNNKIKSLVIMEGSPLTLQCYATGFPEPTVFWKRENNSNFSINGESLYSGNVLEIPVTRKEDGGLYYCIASNGVEPTKVVQKTVYVTIEYPPVTTTTKYFRGQALNYYMDLDCHAEAYPPITIVWIRNGYQLFNNQYYQISNTPTSDNITDSILSINIKEKRLFGDYICQASNAVGSDKVTINLYEITKKTCPPFCN